MKTVKKVKKSAGFIVLIILLTIGFFIKYLINHEKSKGELTIETPSFKEVSVHDPSIIKDQENDIYYVFGTHISGAKSTDLIEWTSFTNGYQAKDNTLYEDLSENLNGSFKWAGENDADSTGGYAVWAPEVIWNESFINEDGSTGAYTIYYSVSSTYMRSAIGLASSKNIEGPYKYVNTIIFSDFLDHEDYDLSSKVNKYWENTNIKELITDNTIKEINQNWFTKDGLYNTAIYPNAIDPNILYDKNDNLWMIYGSWSGGIFALELDKNTGEPIYPGEDAVTEDGRIVDRYFGTKIAAGYGRSAEGPYVIYNKETDYYFLFLTYGGLTADGGYQVRVFRSKDIKGPYYDAMDNKAVFPESFKQGIGNLPGNIDHMNIGNKIIGNFLFESKDEKTDIEHGIGYLSPGHNSVYQDEETGQLFIVFHTRFPNQGEHHELRIHQMFINEEGWPLVAPHRYSGETLKDIKAKDVIGDYEFINHGKDILGSIKKSKTISFTKDHKISGEVKGNWKLIDNNKIEISIDGETYQGLLLEQWDSSRDEVTITFSALSKDGIEIWGSKVKN